LPMSAPRAQALAPDTLRSSVFPDSEQIPLLDAAVLMRDTIDKLLRQDPESVDLSVRNRLTARDSHPVRLLADRVAQAFGDLRFDLYTGVASPRAPAIVPGDPPALLLPPDFAEASENEQAATLARLLTYVALDVPWLEGTAPEEADGMLFGGLRAGFNLWGQGELAPEVESRIATWRGRIGKSASRRVKRALHEAAERIRPQATGDAFRHAVRVTSLRASFALTGNLHAALTSAIEHGGLDGSADPLPGRLLAEPVARELVTFALSDLGLTLCRSAGSI
jgi:hypothetical protein